MRLLMLIGCALLATSRAMAESHSFELPTPDGETVSVAPAANIKLTVVCFLGVECPLAKLYAGRLSEMADTFSGQGVRFVGIDSNRQDTADDLQQFVQQNAVSFPLLHDAENTVADRFGATRTPEVFVLDQQFEVRYQGRVDDQYSPGVARQAASREDLKQALRELLQGQAVSVPVTEATGCLIGKVRRPPLTKVATTEAQVGYLTYSQHVSRVLQTHCLECHRPGEIGPFSMESYDDVVGWADSMLEVIDNGRMPPWHADPTVGHFANARHMPAADRDVLHAWVAAGMPRGDESELPPLATYADGWQLGRTPDAVLPMRDRPFRVPAEGTVEYHYFVVNPGWTEDRWVTAAQIIPGNRAVVHHAIAFIRPPDGSRFRGVGWLAAYVPGQRLAALPAGHARKVPAGSRLVFQMHYTPNGAPQEDLTRIGITFGAAEDVTHEVLTLLGIDQEFEIPPQAPNHEVRGQVGWYPKHGKLLSVTPHMHYRGKAFRLTVERAGAESALLHVPKYDFNWQHSYVLADPLPLEDVDGLKFFVTFDNSRENPFNPDPSQWVNWGDQTWEEMAVTFLEVAEPLAAAGDASVRAAPASSTPAPADAVDSAQSLDRERRIQEFVDDFFQSLDANGDGLVLQTEVPLVVRAYFWQFDHDGDKRASRDELRRVAEERIRD